MGRGAFGAILKAPRFDIFFLKEYMTCINGEHRNLSDLTGKMLEYDPAKRITLGEALKLPFFFSLKWEKRSRFPAGEEAERGFPAKKWKKV